MNWESEIDRYVDHLRAGRVKPASKAYIRNAKNYLNALGRSLEPGQSFLDPDAEWMLNWLLEVQDHGITRKKGPIAAASSNSIKGVVKAALRFLYTPEGTTTPPSIVKWAVGKNRSRVTEADLPTSEEVSFLAKALSPKHRAICLTIRWTGARPSEVLKLKRGDVSPDFNLTFKDTKTGDHRTVPLRKPEGLTALKDWLILSNGAGYIFPSENKPGEPLGYQAHWLAMTRKAKTLGVGAIIPYALRHLRGTEVLAETPGYANYLMGWKSDSTARNYQHVNVKDAAKALEDWEGEQRTDVEQLQGMLNAFGEFLNARPGLAFSLEQIGKEEPGKPVMLKFTAMKKEDIPTKEGTK